MSMQRVLVDMDEVIADPMGAMLEWYNHKYNSNINFEMALGGLMDKNISRRTPRNGYTEITLSWIFPPPACN